jgi:hypothetical protein
LPSGGTDAVWNPGHGWVESEGRWHPATQRRRSKFLAFHSLVLHFFAIVGLLPALIGFGADLSEWHQVYPWPTAQNLWSVGSDGTNEVAVGFGGAVLVSPDTTNWVPLSVPLSSNFQAVTYEAGRWVAVGEGGSIITSENALDWVQRSSGTTEDFTSVVYGGDRFVAVGYYGLSAWSTNGLHWESTATSPWSMSLSSVTYGKGLFVAGGLGVIAISPDGSTWTPLSYSPAHDVNAVWYDGTQFLASETFGGVITSPDGTNWTFRSTLPTTFIYGFTKFQDRWLAAGGGLFVSRDLTNWTSVNTGAYGSGSEGGVYGAFASEGKLFVVGEFGNLLVSSDNTNFLQCHEGRPLSLGLVIRHRDEFMAFSRSGTALASKEGWKWVERPCGSPSFIPLDGFFDGSQSVVAGSWYWPYSGYSWNEIHTTVDGASWTSRPIASSGGLYGVTRSTNLYVAVGAKGAIHTSTNGTVWTSGTLPGAPTLLGIASDGQQFVAVGPPGSNFFSADGLEWIATNSGTQRGLVSAVYGSGRFVAVGARGAVVVSTNGTQWQAITAVTNRDFRRVIFGDGQFVAITDANVFSSLDGLSWTNRCNALASLNGIACGESGFLAAAGGSLYMSGREPLLLNRPLWEPSGVFHFGMFSKPGDICRIESSSNLVDWTSQQLVTNTFGVKSVALPTLGMKAFFRLVNDVPSP